MNEGKLYDDPRGRAVAAFDERGEAEEARQLLAKEGFSDDDIRILHGQGDAREIDTSAKWFADTDEEITMFKHKLEVGKSLVSVPVEDHDTLKKIQGIYQQCGARMMTHFGQWVTRSKKLN